MMRHAKRLLTASMVLSLLAAAPAWAATTLTAKLWDKPDSMAMSGDMGYAVNADAMMGGMGGMGIELSAATAPAGDITFEVTNASTQMIHEMVVVPVVLNTPLPMGADGAVDEDKAGAIGEVSELDPGKSGTVTLNLKAGTYLVICNVGTHYADGMWTLLTIE